MSIARLTLTLASLAALGGFAGCSTQQLQAMNQQLAAVNQSMAAATAPVGPPMPQPTAAQQQQLLAQINQPQAQAQIQTAVQQAGPTIQKVVQFMACYPGWNPDRYLTQYFAPGGAVDMAPPIKGMRYAPAGQCLDIVRMDNWQMPALNALKFRVVYSSPASGESATENITFQREGASTWLLRSIAAY
jgi:hypothetical protein